MFKKDELKLVARYHSCKTRRCADKSVIKKDENLFRKCKDNQCRRNATYMKHTQEYIKCRDTLCEKERKKVHDMFRIKRKKYNDTYKECKNKCPNNEMLKEEPMYKKQLEKCDKYMPNTTNISKTLFSVPWRNCLSKINKTSKYKKEKKKYNKCLQKVCHTPSNSLYKFDIQKSKHLKDPNYKLLHIFDEPEFNSVIH